MKKKLQAMLESIINEDVDKASKHFHSYLSEMIAHETGMEYNDDESDESDDEDDDEESHEKSECSCDDESDESDESDDDDESDESDDELRNKEEEM